MHAKLVRRHPHVFGDAEADTAGRVRERWEAIKTEQEGRVRRLPRRPRGAARRCSTRARCSAGPPPSGSTGPDLDGRAREAARGARRARGRARARRPARPRRPRPIRASSPSSATSSSPSSTSPGVVNVDPELALRATTGRFVAARRARRAARRRGGGELGGARPRRPGGLVQRAKARLGAADAERVAQSANELADALGCRHELDRPRPRAPGARLARQPDRRGRGRPRVGRVRRRGRPLGRLDRRARGGRAARRRRRLARQGRHAGRRARQRRDRRLRRPAWTRASSARSTPR